jgi:heme-degrading monooxygenase HmoA
VTSSANSESAHAAVIDKRPGIVTFIQTWAVSDKDRQQQWLATMATSIHLLRSKPGFISMSLHSGLDGATVVVYAQWRSTEELDAGVTDPAAVTAHNRLAAFGTPAGSLYLVEAVYGPLAS